MQKVSNKVNEKRLMRRQTYINLLTQISEYSKRDSFPIMKK